MKFALEVEARHEAGPLLRRQTVREWIAEHVTGQHPVGQRGVAVYRMHAREVHNPAEGFTRKEWKAIRQAVAFCCAGEMDHLTSAEVAALRRAARKLGVADG